jgi:serralysin
VSANAGKKYSTYGDDAIVSDEAASRQAIKNVNGTGSDFVDGVISGVAWKGGSITYAFPDSKNDYHYNGEKNNNFGTVGPKIEQAVRFTLDTAYGSKANDGFAVEGFTSLKISKGSDTGATLRYAESSSADPTAYAYFPNSGENGGDTWFGHSFNYNNAVQGNYSFATVIHETGHALGLKHGHEAGFGNPAIPNQWDSVEYSVMTYNSFVGDDASGYKNEEFGFPQTYMMADIAALQHMYGANFNVNDGNTTYSWKPNSGNTWVNGKVGLDPGGDNIFATIWDGGGRDKYDLSAYSSNLYIDLRAGAYNVFKASQLADLDAFSNNKSHIARGNIFNALQFENDKRSLIEDAVGGSGNDRMVANQVSNNFAGRGGSDTFIFLKDFLGGKDTIKDFGNSDRIDLGELGYNTFKQVLADAHNDGKDVVLAFGGGDSLTIDNTHKGDLQANDFIL